MTSSKAIRSAPGADFRKREPLIVAIDGPSGVGKSSASREVARRLGVAYLDTGSMYRAVGWAGLQAGIDLEDADAVTELTGSVRIDLEPDGEGGARVLLDGEALGDRIRAPEVSDATSKIAVVSAVRRRMVQLQQEFGVAHGAVVEGRDIGTKVFPQTPHKFFLEASPRVRAERRWKQLAEAGREVDLDALEVEIEARDRRDSERADSPLTWDDSYIRIDTSAQSLPEVVEQMVAAVQGRCVGAQSTSASNDGDASEEESGTKE